VTLDLCPAAAFLFLLTTCIVVDLQGALQLLQDSQGFPLAAEVGGLSKVIGWIVSVQALTCCYISGPGMC